jgi:hypothetical protein
MFSALLEEALLKKVVLLGDVNQLPSIEPGNFLSDLYKSLSIRGCSAMLRNNHRSDAQLIIDNAGFIAEQKIPIINPSKHFYEIKLEELPNVNMDDDLSVGEALWLGMILLYALIGCENSSITYMYYKNCKNLDLYAISTSFLKMSPNTNKVFANVYIMNMHVFVSHTHTYFSICHI